MSKKGGRVWAVVVLAAAFAVPVAHADTYGPTGASWSKVRPHQATWTRVHADPWIAGSRDVE
jgi:hypothetical protein